MMLTWLKRIFTKSDPPAEKSTLSREQQALMDEMREMAARLRRLETQASVQTRRDY